MPDQQIEQQAPEFNPAEYIQKANEREQAAKIGKPIEAPKTKVPQPETRIAEDNRTPEQREKDRSRSEARKFRHVEEAAELRGKVEILERLLEQRGVSADTAVGDDADPEPKREQFKTDAEHQRALGRWDARQEAKQQIGKVREESTQAEQKAAWESHVRAMDKKMLEDAKILSDWETVAEQVAEDPASIQWSPDDHPTLMGLIHSSDVKAFILYHFAKNQEILQKMLDLTKTPGDQIRQFARLEGRLEKLYTPESKTAAQAGKETSEDRGHPAEAKAGRNSGSEYTPKPKPSTEVAARGGAAPPESPKPGTREWMERENLREFARYR